MKKLVLALVLVLLVAAAPAWADEQGGGDRILAAAQQEWLEQLRAEDYVPVYFDGELQFVVCRIIDGRAMAAIWDTFEKSGGDPRRIENRKKSLREEKVLLGAGDLNCYLDRRTGQVDRDGEVIAQIAVTGAEDIEWCGLRGLAEPFGLQVDWDQDGWRIFISSK